jgi:pyridoxal phosphate phosphatase PHOSPHO2
MKILFVWDFDWTVINCNSDEYVPAQFLGHDATSHGFRDLIRTAEQQAKSAQHDDPDAVDWDWHKCVEIMVGRAMNEGTGATFEDILAAAAKMPFLDQIKTAVVEVSEQDETGQMILSDGNTLFINAFLKANDMEACFNEGIMTNVGEFVVDEAKPALKVTHQSAKYGGHSCVQCHRSPNLCKTQALNDKLGQLDNAPEKIVYVGDGANDSCPALNVLRESDALLARGGIKRSEANDRCGAETDEEAKDKNGDRQGGTFGIMAALKHAEKKEGGGKTPKCRVMEWSSGRELRDFIRKEIISDR